MPSWSEVTVVPGEASLAALRRHWHWLLGERWTPLLFSAVGDVFVELPAGAVWWLSTATGSLEHVADSRDEFQSLLGGERADEWFLPGLVAVLREQHPPLAADHCYTFAIFPVFRQGSFSAENMHPAPCAAHFAVSGDLHRQLQGLADGATVQLKVE